MTQQKNQVTNQDILTSINDFSTTIDQKFNKVDQSFNKIDQRLEKIEKHLSKHDKRFVKIESLMVTKDYLDEKMAKLRGDLTLSLRKEDNKLKTLTGLLFKRKTITKTDVNTIALLEPFPELQ